MTNEFFEVVENAVLIDELSNHVILALIIKSNKDLVDSEDIDIEVHVVST